VSRFVESWVNKERARCVKKSATSKTRYFVTNPSVLLHQALSRAPPASATRRTDAAAPNSATSKHSITHHEDARSPYYFFLPPLPFFAPFFAACRLARARAVGQSRLALSSPRPLAPRRRASPDPLPARARARAPRASPDPPSRALARLARARTSSAAIFSSRARRHRPSALSASAPERAATTAPPTNVALATANAAFSAQNGIVDRRRRARECGDDATRRRLT